jgi:hypothetical protein
MLELESADEDLDIVVCQARQREMDATAARAEHVGAARLRRP